MNIQRIIVWPVAAATLAACAGSSDTTQPGTDVAVTTTVPVTNPETTAGDPPATEPPVTETPGTSPPNPPAADSPEASEFPAPREIVELLASDELNGRNNQTEGSAAARAELLGRLAFVAEPGNPDGTYVQEFDLGTNIVGIVPGSGDLADEYVVVGAH